jgi:bisphosphoglycerate-independent phosphoglycerate mutase (AlkP superfamily)
MTNVLAEWLAKQGLKQAHIAGSSALITLIAFIHC